MRVSVGGKVGWGGGVSSDSLGFGGARGGGAGWAWEVVVLSGLLRGNGFGFEYVDGIDI